VSSTLVLVFSSLLFLAVAAGAWALFVHRSGEGARQLQNRLRSLGRDVSHRSEQLRVERDVRYSSIPALDSILRRLNVGQALELMLYQAGMTMRVGVLILLIAGFGMGGYFIGLVMLHRVAPSVLFMALAAPMPYFFVIYKKQQRMKAFTEEFPDALDLLVSALRAGLSFAAAMQIVAEESPEPVRGEFAVTVEEQGLGLDFRETLVNLTKRVGSLDLRFFVTAVILQRETGGNLAEILENTAKLIRDRFRVLGDIKTFTAQGRLTGAILFCLPLGISIFTITITPEYFRPMLETETGRTALWIAGALQISGALVIRQIVNIKV
jgi:tight adherence protein B